LRAGYSSSSSSSWTESNGLTDSNEAGNTQAFKQRREQTQAIPSAGRPVANFLEESVTATIERFDTID